MPTTLRVRHSPQVHDVARGSSSLNDSCSHSPRCLTSVPVTRFVTSGDISRSDAGGQADTTHLDSRPRIKRLRPS